MMPKIRPMNSNILVVGGQRIDNLRNYDENLSTLVGTKKVEEFPNFEREELSFGMPKEFRDDTIFEDMANFDPVTFIKDEGSTLIYPQVLANLSAKDLDAYDGVIEPLVIRSRASRNSIDSPFEAHDVRGALSNAAEDVRRRGNLIVDYVFPVDRSVEPYLDELFEQDTLGLPQPPFLSNPSDLTPPFEDGTDWEDQENFALGTVKKRLILSQTISDWDPSNVVYYTISGEELVEHDFRGLITCHLNFEETAAAGNVVLDKTGNGRSGTLFNAATVDFLDSPGYITNRGSLNLQTNALNNVTIDNVVVNYNPVFQASLGSSFSISFWAKFDTNASEHWVISKTGNDLSNKTEYVVFFDTARRLVFRITDDLSTSFINNYIQVRSSILTIGSWYHFIVTYNGGTDPSDSLQIFVNGVLDVNSPTTNGSFTKPKNNLRSLYIGGPSSQGLVSGGSYDVRGRIASFEFWNVELTADQASILYELQTADKSGSYLTDYEATLGRVSSDQMFPRKSTSARSGQIVNLEDSPGTDSIVYAGMKR